MPTIVRPAEGSAGLGERIGKYEVIREVGRGSMHGFGGGCDRREGALVGRPHVSVPHRPEAVVDLIILDLYMPGMNGPGGLRRLREIRPDTPVAVLSGSVNAQDIEGVLDAGAAGYLPKTMIGAAFVNALSLVLNGERFVPSEFYLGLRDRGPNMTAQEADAGGDRAPVGLTSRQWAVLRELVAGRSNKEIAKILGIEEITVKVHLQAVFKRLQVSNRTQAATEAMRLGLVGKARG